jgi:hypothetical protein
MVCIDIHIGTATTRHVDTVVLSAAIQRSYHMHENTILRYNSFLHRCLVFISQ